MPFFQQVQSGQVCWEGGGGCQDGRVSLLGTGEEMSRWAAVATPTETSKQTQPARKEERKEATSPAELFPATPGHGGSCYPHPRHWEEGLGDP